MRTMTRCVATVLFVVATATHPTTESQGTQAQMPVVPPAAVSAEEAAVFAQYWVLLAGGRFAEAAQKVRPLLDRYPRNVNALSLVIEADIAHAGAKAALMTYETWLGSRLLEEPMVLRRITRAVLYEWARQSTYGNVRSEALLALAEDGDEAAQSVIAAIAASGQEAGLRAAARLKDAQAIRQVVARMKASPGDKLRDIQILADAGSQQAVPALIEVLADPQPPNRAAAAEALGKLGGSSAERALEPVLKDAHGLVRTAAAGALFRLGNFAGVPILQELAASENASMRRTAAVLTASQPDERWLALVRGLLTDPDPAIRLDAARLLAPHDPGTARVVLDQLSADNNLAIREETELARADLPTSSMAELRTILRSGLPLARVRAARRLLVVLR